MLYDCLPDPGLLSFLPLAELDVVLLSRIQFALTIMFHYLFPPLTIGLGVVLVWLGFRFIQTQEPIYREAQKFWTKIFAVNFAIGVASGIVMEFQFGTNWAVYSEFVGDVFGSALAAEGIFAFFLESGFLAVLVFGWNKVGPKMHFFSTLMVCLGGFFSSIWIVVANSWQQTPAGHEIREVLRAGEPFLIDGVPQYRAEIVDFWAMVFNPTSVIRIVHVWTGALIVGGALVCSIGAWYVLKNRHHEFARRSFNGGLIVLTFGAIAAFFTGHIHGQITYAHQPAKMAAYEGLYEDYGVAGLTLFGIPDSENETVHFNIKIPKLYSFLVHDDFNEPVVGLGAFRPEDRPPVQIPFWVYRVMIGTGSLLLVLTLMATYFRVRGTLFEKRWLMWSFVPLIVLAVVSNHAGWICAEVGRQPFIVYPVHEWTGGAPGVGDIVRGPDGFVEIDERATLRTDDAVSRSVVGSQVLMSILGFGAIYGLLFFVWLAVLNRKIQHGPDPEAGGTGWRPSPDDGGDLRGFFDAAASRPDHAGSMTDAKGAGEPTGTRGDHREVTP